jgi:hypothetical protein
MPYTAFGTHVTMPGNATITTVKSIETITKGQIPRNSRVIVASLSQDMHPLVMNTPNPTGGVLPPTEIIMVRTMPYHMGS